VETPRRRFRDGIIGSTAATSLVESTAGAHEDAEVACELVREEPDWGTPKEPPICPNPVDSDSVVKLFNHHSDC